MNAFQLEPSSAPGRRLVCDWCNEPMPAGLRRDAETCSQACRQARHRFSVAGAPAASTAPMRFAYADPPYIGMARRLYNCEEVDHRELVARLVAEYPDGWALSASADSLQEVLALCPPGMRVCAWVKGARAAKARRTLNAWEPLLVYRGRASAQPVDQSFADALVWSGRQHSHPGALVGMKSAAFCEWMFRQLGAERGDELGDLFPGSGAVARAWALYQREPSRLEPRRVASAGESPKPSRLAGVTARLVVPEEPSRAAAIAMEAPRDGSPVAEDLSTAREPSRVDARRVPPMPALWAELPTVLELAREHDAPASLRAALAEEAAWFADHWAAYAADETETGRERLAAHEAAAGRALRSWRVWSIGVLEPVE